MSDRDSTAFGIIASLVSEGYHLQIEMRLNQYEITVWKDKGKYLHSHYQGASLIETVMKIDKKHFDDRTKCTNEDGCSNAATKEVRFKVRGSRSTSAYLYYLCDKCIASENSFPRAAFDITQTSLEKEFK